MEIKTLHPGIDAARFVEEFASLLEPWGHARSIARVHAYLLLSADPVDLDKIADDLQMSRSAAWNAARLLEGFGHIRRHTVPGTKRAWYVQSDNFGAPMGEQMKLLENMANLLEACAPSVPDPSAARVMNSRADFYRKMRLVIMAGIHDLKAAND